LERHAEWRVPECTGVPARFVIVTAAHAAGRSPDQTTDVSSPLFDPQCEFDTETSNGSLT
jgi:hypothetical protein